jgi:hypothetical protein
MSNTAAHDRPGAIRAREHTSTAPQRTPANKEIENMENHRIKNAALDGIKITKT